MYDERARPSSRQCGPAGIWHDWWRKRYLDLGDDEVGLRARQQGFVVSAAQLRTLGIHDHDTRRELRRGQWSKPLYGVVAPLDLSAENEHVARRRTHAVKATGSALLRSGCVISGRSSAILRGLPTLVVPGAPELTELAARTLGRRSAAHLYGATLQPVDVTDWFGAPVTGVARTVVDLARRDRRDGLMSADAALREGLIGDAELRRVLETAAGWPGVRQAREVVALASPLAESPLESLTRLAMRDSGFPTPELQVVINDPARGRHYRVDMLFREARLIVEIDGLEKYDRAEVRREKLRETRLRALGYRVERVLWDDVVRHWPETAARLWAAMHGAEHLPRRDRQFRG